MNAVIRHGGEFVVQPQQPPPPPPDPTILGIASIPTTNTASTPTAAPQLEGSLHGGRESTVATARVTRDSGIADDPEPRLHRTHHSKRARLSAAPISVTHRIATQRRPPDNIATILPHTPSVFPTPYPFLPELPDRALVPLDLCPPISTTLTSLRTIFSLPTFSLAPAELYTLSQPTLGHDYDPATKLDSNDFGHSTSFQFHGKTPTTTFTPPTTPHSSAASKPWVDQSFLNFSSLVLDHAFGPKSRFVAMTINLPPPPPQPILNDTNLDEFPSNIDIDIQLSLAFL